MQADHEQQREKLKKTATEIFKAALEEVSPERCIRRNIRLSGNNLSFGKTVYDLSRIHKLYLIGAGKASAAMASVIEKILGNKIHDGIIITKYAHGTPLKRCRLLEAGHPIPDENGCRAANALLDLVGTAEPNDLLLCLISGGGSALTPAPAPGIDLAGKQETTRLLLECGATIHEINIIRKHLSRIKGGRLCRAAGGAAIVSLILSDVIEDDLDIIASGLTAPDTSTFDDCLSILSTYNLFDRIPASVRQHIQEGAEGRGEETPKPGDEIFARVSNRIIGSISDALMAAQRKAALLGFRPMILTSTLHGEAREAARVITSIACEISKFSRPISAPACLLSGGETTVTVQGRGLGGRNTEFALAAAGELSGIPGIMLLSAGTDGTDGPTDAAGAFADGSTTARAGNLGLSAVRHLADNNSYNYFKLLQDLLITGPTRTNVMDLQILLIL
jgi:glycerate 2-kinase